MIFDNLKNARLYFSLGEGIQKGLQYLASTDFTGLEPGRYDIDGERVYAMVQTYNTKPSSAGKWEAHKKYSDIQYIVSGREKMGFTSSDKVINLEEYDEERDYAIYKGEGNFLIADEGQFAIFFPTDIHMPSLALNIPKEVKKVVVKVLTESGEGNKEQESIVI
jgi:YhcH/YjgK/YiaL family protein